MPERYELAFRGASTGMLVLALDGRLLEVNEAVCRLAGRSEAALLAGNALDALVHPDDHELERVRWRPVFDGSREVVTHEHRILPLDGESRWALTTLTLVRDEHGDPRYVVGHMIEVTERRAAAENARRQAARHAAVAALGKVALACSGVEELWVAAVDSIAEVLDAEIVSVARVRERGLELAYAAGVRERGSQAADHSLPDRAHALRALDFGAPVVVSDIERESRFAVEELRARGLRSGVALPILCAQESGVLAVYRTAAGELSGEDLDFLESIATILSSASARIASEHELLHRSLHDAVTGLPNRRFLIERLQREVAGRCGAGPATMISIGLVNRHAIHESLGFDAGDVFLEQIGARLAAAVGEAAMLSRPDGDELAIYVPGLGEVAEAEDYTRGLLAGCGGPIALAGLTLHPRLAAGVAVVDDVTHARPGDLIRDASTAMYRAWAGSRDVVLFDEPMRIDTVERLALVSDLRRALDTPGELRLVFQPVVSRFEGRVIKFEALVRWQHPMRGFVGPDRFVPLAEEHGLVGPLGAFVLGEALDQLVSWRAAGLSAGERCMGVNISRVQLDDKRLAATILDEVRRRGLMPTDLVVEITESALTGDRHAARENVRRLAEAGIRIALDDFGVGQSSLASLTELPLDILKLDRGFVRAVGGSSQRIAVMAAVSQLAEALDLRVVAEGIEDADEADITEQLGCDLGQGYYYSRPLPPSEVPDAIERLDAMLGQAVLRGVSAA